MSALKDRTERLETKAEERDRRLGEVDKALERIQTDVGWIRQYMEGGGNRP